MGIEQGIKGKTILIIDSRPFYREAEPVLLRDNIFPRFLSDLTIPTDFDLAGYVEEEAIDGIIAHITSIEMTEIMDRCLTSHLPVVVLLRYFMGGCADDWDRLVQRWADQTGLPVVEKYGSVESITAQAVGFLKPLFENNS